MLNSAAPSRLCWAYRSTKVGGENGGSYRQNVAGRHARPRQLAVCLSAMTNGKDNQCTGFAVAAQSHPPVSHPQPPLVLAAPQLPQVGPPGFFEHPVKAAPDTGLVLRRQALQVLLGGWLDNEAPRRGVTHESTHGGLGSRDGPYLSCTPARPGLPPRLPRH